NIIASIDPDDKNITERYLMAAHYDSRPRAEYDADPLKREDWIDGANDGASGVAVLMELANLFVSQKPPVGIDLLLMDGEDFGRPGDLDEYFLGAKDFVKRDIKGKYEFALVIDLVGEIDLKIYKEEFSNKYSPEITDLVWSTAEKLGEKVFVDSVIQGIHDDHLSFMTIGLQAAVIIDLDYIYWHTTLDNADKCSPTSLGSVGRVVTDLIYGL
ncbi:MAG: M28 family peptidase, partial [candidate division Zixibacteria bacterium]|nr:M28 family peptidase [candidate division Zixibacteria bacterium]